MLHHQSHNPFDSWRIGPLTLKNRFIKAATNEGMAKGHLPTKKLIEHHQNIALGGVAMTTVAYCAVSADGKTFENQVVLEPNSLFALQELTQAVHQAGAAICAQITHGGAFNFLPRLSTKYPLSSSGGLNAAGVLSGRLFKTAMTLNDMDKISREFVCAAQMAKDAGFDAVEIHMGHGYLLSQFLSPIYNRRTDAYGGDAIKRAAFPARVLQQVLEAVGDDLAVICKLSVDEGVKHGGHAKESAQIAKVLEQTGAHLLVLSGGMNVEAPWAIFGSPIPIEAIDINIKNPLLRQIVRQLKRFEPRVTFQELYLLAHSRQIREAVSMPLAFLGGVKSFENVRQVIGEGFDAVVMGRALLHNPNLITDWQNGQYTRSACTACNQCVVMMYTDQGTHCILDEV